MHSVASGNLERKSSITFFEPLKEDNTLGQGGLLQSFLGFFKKQHGVSNLRVPTKRINSNFASAPSIAITNQTAGLPTTSIQDVTSTIESCESVTSETVHQSRSYSSHSLDDEVLSRPDSLNIRQIYKEKDPRLGSEVELRIKNFSTILNDLPKRITKSNQQKLGQFTPSGSGSDLKQYWMPDKHCHECYECNERFTTFRRRHHCRICGHVFCSRCCFQLISGEIIDYSGMVRSCTYCYKLVMSHGKKPLHSRRNPRFLYTELDGVTEVTHEADNTGNGLPSDLHSRPSQRVGRTRSLASMRGSPIDDQPAISLTSLGSQDTPNWTSPYDVFDATPGVMPDIDETMDEQVYLAKSSIQLHDLWVKMTDEDDGADFRDHRLRLRKFSRSITGTDLVDWLLSSEVATTRQQGIVFGQALLDAEWLKNAADKKDEIFRDEDCLYQPGKAAAKDPHHQFTSKANNSAPVVDTVCNTRFSLDSSDGVDAGTEPNWVREITIDDDNISDISDYDDEMPFWGIVHPGGQSLLTNSVLHLSDEGSSSPLSALSYSSFVEIDNDRSTIKYCKRKSNQTSGDQRKGLVELKQPRFVDSGSSDINADYIRGYLSWHGAYSSNLSFPDHVGWRKDDCVSANAKQVYRKLQEFYFQHSMKFLQQLFEAEQLEPSWADVIVPLVKRVCEAVLPNCEVNMDIAHYVHIKKCLDGSPQESSLVSGVVFTKNVVNNHMKSRVDNPVIMLLATPLEYQRVSYKYASLDPVVRQEPEFFKNLTSRILIRQPDLVISQCGVAHEARRLLMDAGITLIINVKEKVMERLSRCTGAVVARSVDQLQNVRLGTCGRFRIHRHFDGKRRHSCSDGNRISSASLDEMSMKSFKLVAYVDGCKPANGCTVMLRQMPDYSEDDADAQARNCLSRVKSVFIFLLRMMYHCKLELSYLMDQQDLASVQITSRKAKSQQQERGHLVSEEDVSNPSETLASRLESAVADTEDQRLRSNTSCSRISDVNTIVQEHLADKASEMDDDVVMTSSFESLFSVNLNDSYASASPRDILENFHLTLLSYSPLIRPSVPFLLTGYGKSSPLYRYLPDDLFWSCKFAGADDMFPCDHHRLMHHSFQNPNLFVSDYERHRVSRRSRTITANGYHSSSSAIWRTPARSITVEREKTYSNGLDEKEKRKEGAGNFARRNNALFIHERVPSRTSAKSISTINDEHHLSNGLDSHNDSGAFDSSSSSFSRNDTHSPAYKQSLSDETAISPGGQGDMNGCRNDDENIAWLPEKHYFLTSSLSQPASSQEIKDMLADFRSNGSSLFVMHPRPELILDFKRPIQPSKAAATDEIEEIDMNELEDGFSFDCLSPHSHQHIFVLFSSYSQQSPNAPYPCVIPWAVDIDFYRGNDITLGGFLKRYCFRPSYHCSNTACRRPMVEHVRSFVHGSTCMNIVLKELSKPVASPHILSWCWNPDTKTSTDLRPLSHDAASMSFAKFLELRLQTFRFNQDDITDSNNDTDVEIPPFTSFQYFLHQNIVAAFKCFQVNVSEVALPRSLLGFEDKADWLKLVVPHDTEGLAVTNDFQLLVQSMNMLSKIGYESMDYVCDMVATQRSSNPFDQLTSSEQVVSGEDICALNVKRESLFEQLMDLHHDERCLLRESVDSIHLKLQSLKTCSDMCTLKTEMAVIENEGKCTWKISPGDHSTEHSTPSCTFKNNEFGPVVLEEQAKEELCLSFLHLTCLICRLVQTWNARMATVAEQDRQSRKSARPSLTELYGDQPLSLDCSPRNRESKLKSSASLKAVPEKTSRSNENITAEESSQTAVHVVPPLRRLQRARTSLEFKDIHIRSPKLNTNETAKTEREDEITPLRNPSTTPIPVPNRSLERHGSFAGKKFTKTTSSMSMKTFVSNLLSNSSHVPVEMPFPSDQHYLLPKCLEYRVVVRDNEPSSIVAYALHTPEYKRYLATGHQSNGDDDISKETLEVRGSVSKQLEEQLRVEIHADSGLPRVVFQGTSKVVDSTSNSLGVPRQPADGSPSTSPIPSPPPSPTPISPHVEVQFGDSTTKFYCKVYFASDFRELRKQILDGSEADYIKSLTRCVRWAASGGKSGSAFHKTLDDRFVLKQMSRFEVQSFLEVARDYLDYVTKTVRNKLPTALSKIVGVYRVSFRNTSASRTYKQDILVMENLFYKRDIQQVFDLKGSVRNRHVKTNSDVSSTSSIHKSASSTLLTEEATSVKNDLVLMDENLLRIMRDNPFYVHEHTKILIKKALFEDSKFLSSHLIIDYSLLVGIDSERKEIVVGIIDYLRTFTWDKKLEMVVKSYGMIGRQGTRSMPTVVSPEIYRSRFCEAMERYFQVVPDRWFGMHSYKCC